MVAQATVHTTGVNWESVAVIVSAITVVLGAILGLFAKWVAGEIVNAIDRFQIAVTSKLDTRLSVLEAQATRAYKRQTRDD